MATNKRKDAAALFELIEKSTLKVPKGGNGALKIPAWWSSKVNPPTEPQHHESENPEAAAPAAPEKPAHRFPEPLTPNIDPFEKLRHEHTTKPEPVDPTVKPPKESLPVDLPPTPGDQISQSAPEANQEPNWDELPLPTPDEPEPASAPEAAPAASVPVSAPVSRSASSVPRSAYGASAPKTQAQSPSFSASRPTSSAYRPPVAVPPSTRQAAPSYTSSYNGSRMAQNQNFVVLMLEAPLWVKVSFCTAIIVLIALAIAVFTPSKSNRTSATPPTASAVENTPAAVPPASQLPAAIPEQPVPTRTGRFVAANQVQRKSDKYYLVLSSVRSQNIANEIAKFTAENGVDDVTVERHQDRGSEGRVYNNFKVISVQGVSQLSSEEARAMRVRFVEVGRKHPESKQFHKGIFDDAYFARVTRGK